VERDGQDRGPRSAGGENPADGLVLTPDTYDYSYKPSFVKRGNFEL
jgi:hypothetical protein